MEKQNPGFSLLVKIYKTFLGDMLTNLLLLSFLVFFVKVVKNFQACPGNVGTF